MILLDSAHNPGGIASLLRALETAYIILGKEDPGTSLPIHMEAPADIPPVIVDKRLIEMDYGPYEGMDLMHPAPEVLAFFKDFVNVPAPDGMEPLDAVIARAGCFLEDIREEAAVSNILISTHAIAMKGALEYLTPDSHGRCWSEYVGNCAVFSAEVLPDGTWTVPKIW